jgi:hypothetical protein
VEFRTDKGSRRKQGEAGGCVQPAEESSNDYR